VAQTGVFGVVNDQTGSGLPGVLVELRGAGEGTRETATDTIGRYAFDAVPQGRGQLVFNLVNFAPV
jgi:hypothetical protein